MASADHQPETQPGPQIQNMTNHQANSLIEAQQQQQQQRQQQELIKLIAQHFHNQFYQIANNNQQANSQLQALSEQRQQHRLNPTRVMPTNIAHFQSQQQRQQQHYPAFPALNLVRPLDLNTMNHLIANNQTSQQQHFLAASNNLIRSQQMSAAAANGTGLALSSSNSSCLDFSSGLSTSGLQANMYPSMTELGLFNALGLNLINSQLAPTSRGRPTLDQAHNPFVRQFSEATSSVELDRLEQHQLALAGRVGKGLDVAPSNDFRVNLQQPDSKELLKFSINTILGCGSPPKSASPLNEDSRGDHSITGSPLDDSSNKDNCELGQAGRGRSWKRLDVGGGGLHQREQSRVSECDPESDYDDRSALNSPRTPPINASSQPGSSSSIRLASLQQTNSSGHPQPHHQQQPQLQQGQSARLVTSSDHLSADYPGIKFNLGPSAAGVMSANVHNRGPQLAHQHQQLQQQQQQQHQQQQHQQQQQLVSCQVSGQPGGAPLFLPASNTFPWTVAARGKPRRGMMRRAVFSDSQRVGLEKRFQLQKYISKPDRKKLAEKLGLRDSQVKIWFQNRRMKWRNSKERELLSAGGSREQTLPTRNNPNPDLSDVGETVKRLTSAISSGPPSNNSNSK